MRIALAHKLYRLTGGAEVFFRETERVLREAGHDTLMIATGDAADAEGVDNLLLLKAPSYDSGGLLTKVQSLPSAIYDSKKKASVKTALAEFRPDILHIFAINVHLSPSIIVAAVELDIPVVATFNDYKHICPNYKLFHHGKICMDCLGGKFYKAAVNACCKESRPLSVASAVEAYVHKWLDIYGKVDHFTFSSDFMASVTRTFWNGRDFSWTKLLNPFDSAKYVAPGEYRPYGIYFGRIIDEKGVDRLVRAAALAPDVPIKIVGDGPELAKLRKMAAESGLVNVEFLGPKWGEDLDEILKYARFVVVPSIWHENFPYVINQSFAFGRPVIGANRGGIPELVNGGERGFVFDPDDVGELASLMRRLANSPAEAQELGVNAKAWSDGTFRDDVAYVDLMNAYGRAVDENRRRRG